jgi:hypothetical protein
VGNSTAIAGRHERKDTVNRKALITFVLGATLVIAPAARAGGLMPDGGGSGSAKGVVLHTDVLGGNGNAVSSSTLTTRPYGMNEATYQAVLSRGKGFNLRPAILGGHGGVSAGSGRQPAATPSTGAWRSRHRCWARPAGRGGAGAPPAQVAPHSF